MGPLQKYRDLVAAGSIAHDPAQVHVVEKLQALSERLQTPGNGMAKRVARALLRPERGRAGAETRMQGIYLYGAAGRGKSMLMDLFFDTAPVTAKRRVHFHAFMQEIHSGISSQRKQGATDPVRHVADAVADTASLLCFDEMQITDITDGMLVGQLLKRLFERGVVVVATSNRHPDELYDGGWNRQAFLPFIEVIKSHMQMLELRHPVDYRRVLAQAEHAYHVPANNKASAAMDALWLRLLDGEPETALTISAHGRSLSFLRSAGRMLRADFKELCVQALGSAEYLALAKALDFLILENVPVLSPARYNEASRFITLIDALYEARVKLIMTADAEPDALYVEGEGSFEFGRTASRLEEMRSTGWWQSS